MKRLTSIFLIFTLIFALASCGKIENWEEHKAQQSAAEASQTTQTTATTGKPPVVKKDKKTKKFKDEKGKTVYVVEVVLPEITKNCEKSVAEFINTVTNKIFEEECERAEVNVPSASSYMKNSESKTPWSSELDFETTYISSKYVCFLIKKTISYFGIEGIEPRYETKCFNVQTGAICSVWDFASDPSLEEEITAHLADYMMKNAPKDFDTEDYAGLSQVYVEKIKTVFNPNQFYLTDEGIGFYFERGDVAPAYSGVYQRVIPWADLGGYFVHPEEI